MARDAGQGRRRWPAVSARTGRVLWRDAPLRGHSCALCELGGEAPDCPRSRGGWKAKRCGSRLLVRSWARPRVLRTLVTELSTHHPNSSHGVTCPGLPAAPGPQPCPLRPLRLQFLGSCPSAACVLFPRWFHGCLVFILQESSEVPPPWGGPL